MGSVYKRRRGSLEKNNKRASYNTRARGREALWNSLEICLSNFISRLLMLLSELAIGINSATAGIYQRVGLFFIPSPLSLPFSSSRFISCFIRCSLKLEVCLYISLVDSLSLSFFIPRAFILTRASSLCALNILRFCLTSVSAAIVRACHIYITKNVTRRLFAGITKIYNIACMCVYMHEFSQPGAFSRYGFSSPKRRDPRRYCSCGTPCT